MVLARAPSAFTLPTSLREKHNSVLPGLGTMWNSIVRRNPRIALLQVFFAAVIFFAANDFALGQVAGAISGTVEDPSGAAVREATVTVTSVETGATRVVATNESGRF